MSEDVLAGWALIALVFVVALLLGYFDDGPTPE